MKNWIFALSVATVVSASCYGSGQSGKDIKDYVSDEVLTNWCKGIESKRYKGYEAWAMYGPGDTSSSNEPGHVESACFDAGEGLSWEIELQCIRNGEMRGPLPCEGFKVEDCLDGFQKERNCELGGDSSYTLWRYRYVPLVLSSLILLSNDLEGNNLLTNEILSVDPQGNSCPKKG